MEQGKKSDPDYHIVVVDDDVDIQAFVRFVLERVHFSVTCHHDSEAAMAAMHTHPPDLIITDLMMKSLDEGFAFAQCVKATPSLASVPVLMMTAASSQRGFNLGPQSKEELKAMHVDAFLNKPLTPRNLVRQVCKLLSIPPR